MGNSISLIIVERVGVTFSVSYMISVTMESWPVSKLQHRWSPGLSSSFVFGGEEFVFRLRKSASVLDFPLLCMTSKANDCKYNAHRSSFPVSFFLGH